MGRLKDYLIRSQENPDLDPDAEYVFIPGVGIYPKDEVTEPQL